MYIHTLLLLVVFGAITVFTAVNWESFLKVSNLSVGVKTIEAPLGLIMLALLALITVLFLVFLAYLETSVIITTRRHMHELRTHRERADQAETSRFNELHRFLEAELPKLTDQTANLGTDLHARLEQLEQDLKSVIERAGNTLSAYIGELDDRLEQTVSRPNRNSVV